MNKRLTDAIEQIKALPDEQQEQAASLLLDFLNGEAADADLTPEQWAEVEEALSDREEYASEGEVKAFFARLLK